MRKPHSSHGLRGRDILLSNLMKETGRITVYHGGIATIPKGKISEAAKKLAYFEDKEEYFPGRTYEVRMIYDGKYYVKQVKAENVIEVKKKVIAAINTGKEYRILSVDEKTGKNLDLRSWINANIIVKECNKPLKKYVNVDIQFYNLIENREDEVEFSVPAKDIVDHLDELFTDFCKENQFPCNTVYGVCIVETADKLEDLS